MSVKYTFDETQITFHTRSFGDITIKTDDRGIRDCVGMMLATYDQNMSSHKTLVKTVAKALKNPDANVEAIVVGYHEILKAL